MSRNYEWYKAWWERTAPIRGRAVDVRPLGKRSRDWETITRKSLADGQFAFCAKLYETECVEYRPNGDIVLRTGKWFTPTTAEFIHAHSPFVCYKKYNKLWIRIGLTDVNKKVEYPLGGELVLRCVDESTNRYEPVNAPVIKQRVVDRDKAKAARASLQPLLAFAKAFLSMSDGWIMHSTMLEFFEKSHYGSYAIEGVGSSTKMHNAMTEATTDDYLRILCMLSTKIPTVNRRVAEREPDTPPSLRMRDAWYDRQFSFEMLKEKVYSIVNECGDIYKEIEVEPSDKAITNVII